MTSVRAVAGTIGLVAAGLGLATAAVPAAATAVPVSAAVSLLGNDYLLVAIFGLAGVGAVVTLVSRRAVHGVNQARPPDPEGLPAGDSPGADFDRLVRRARIPLVWRWRGDRERVRDRLRQAAVVALVQTSGRSREAARASVEDGTWTDDRIAAAFLGESANAPAGAAGSFRRRVRRTVRAIERVGGRDHA